MKRRALLRAGAVAAATTLAGCMWSDEPPRIAVRNRRSEPIEVTQRLERWGGVDTRCDPQREVNGESTTAAVEPEERQLLLMVPERGLYGTALEIDGEEHVSCLEYTGNESSFAWVVDTETVNFVSHTQ